MALPAKVRNWTFTNFNPDFDYKCLVNDHKVKYIAYGEETCPKTSRKHHQGWLCFFNTRRQELGKDRQRAADASIPGAHLEPMRGSLQQNDKYCSKQTAGVLVEFGDEPKQGNRVDLDAIKKELEDGTTTVDDIVLDHPVTFHQYGRTLREMETILLWRKKREWMTEGVWYYGPTAVGKSHKAPSACSPPPPWGAFNWGAGEWGPAPL